MSVGLAVSVLGVGLVSAVVEAPLASAAALTPATYAAAVLADSPLGYWRMDEATASGADSSPSGFNGIVDPAVTTVVGGPFAADQRVYQFPATGHCGINLDAYAASLKVDTLSVEAWVLAESPLLGQIYRVRTEGVELDVTNGSAIIGGYYAGGSDSITKPLPTGVWHHVVGVHSSASWSLYIDGALVGSTPSNGPIYYGGSQVSIGTDPACGAAPFIGRLSNVAFYASALSPTRVAAHYSAAPGTDAGCV